MVGIICERDVFESGVKERRDGESRDDHDGEHCDVACTR